MPKIVDHDQRRNEIADAVLRLIASGGTNSVTTRNAAEEAGWSAGTVNHYFDSRSHLLLGALRRAAELQGQELKRIQREGQLSPLDRLRWMIESNLPLDERRVALQKIFLEYYANANGRTETHEEVTQYLSNWRRVASRIIQACVDDGSITTSRAINALAVEIVAFTDGLAIHALLDPSVLQALTEGETLTISIGQDWSPIELTGDYVSPILS